jgi:hypothetical protein
VLLPCCVGRERGATFLSPIDATGRAVMLANRSVISWFLREHPYCFVCFVRRLNSKIGTTVKRACLCGMFANSVLEESFNIAWGFLEKAGELGQADASANILLNAIEQQLRAGERRRLMIANRAISAYREQVAKYGAPGRDGDLRYFRNRSRS